MACDPPGGNPPFQSRPIDTDPYDRLNSSARLTGFIATIDAGDVTFSVGPGVLMKVDSTTDPLNPILVNNIPVSGFDNVTPDFLGISGASFIYLNVDTLQLVMTDEIFDDGTTSQSTFLEDHIEIGIATHPESTIINLSNDASVYPHNVPIRFTTMSQSLGAFNDVGFGGANTVSGKAGTTSILKATGRWWRAGINTNVSLSEPDFFESATVDTSIVGEEMFQSWRQTDNVNGELSLATIVNMGVYDDNTAVEADALPQGVVGPNEWTAHRLFHVTSSNRLFLQYGQSIHSTEEEAERALRTEEFLKTPISRGLTGIASVIVRGNGADLSLRTDAVIRQATKVGDFI